MIFADRVEAGKILARKLQRLKINPDKLLIVAIPRGGIVVAEEIARRLTIPLLVLVIKKIGSPTNSELAIGATASFGKPVLDRWLIKDLNVSSDFLKKEIIKKKKEALAREKFLGVEIVPRDFGGKIVVVVDDGLATGQTAKAAAKVVRGFSPEELILAVPCASPLTLKEVEGDYDKVVCAIQEADFMAVGQFYRDFRPVSDEEVKEILNQRS